MENLSPIERRLLNDYQRAFPLVARPYDAIAQQLQLPEASVIACLRSLRDRGVISRIGPVFSPGSIGSSLLAALAVPPERLETVAGWVSTLPEVNHNYQREHVFNLWFVVAAPDEARVQAVLAMIRRETGLELLALPLLEQFHIDLGFDLFDSAAHSVRRRVRPAPVRAIGLDAWQTRLVARLQEGLALVPEPFADLRVGQGHGAQPGSDDAALAPEPGVSEVLRQIAAWCDTGVIRRFGVVVRHHELGYRDNAMVVWDVPDADVAHYGGLAAEHRAVTLCYRRPRQMPVWPYNLFCMIHGKDRDTVRAAISEVNQRTGLSAFASRVLFSSRRFKQCGARYVANR